MSDLKTQSVCKHCHEKIFRAHGSWQTSEGFLTCMHNKSSFSAGHEPVSEPASTGEPPVAPPEPCEDCVWHGCEGSLGGCGCKCHKRPARPSEPSPPQTSAEEWKKECLGVGACKCVGRCQFAPAPQPVSDPAPSPTPSVSTEQSSLISRLRYIGGKLRTDLNDSAMLYPRNWNLEAVQQLISEWDGVATEAVKLEMQAAAPSVAGTQPTPECPVCGSSNGRTLTVIRCDNCGTDQSCGCPEDTCEVAGNCPNLPRKSSGAAQGTPQVEEIAREIASSVIGPLLHAAKREGKVSTNFLDEVAIETRTILRKHGVGAPAQPGPQETK